MIKLSDFIFKYFEKQGVQHAFMLSGGGIMHLVDSLGNSNIKYVCCHHEQACSIAAQAYDMYKEQLSICLVTTGPGGTNALTGAAAAYVDSTPVIYMTGQVKRDDFASIRGVRQFGAQENDIVAMAKSVTKYAVLVEKPEDILYELQKATYIAMHGRKGPVWLDIPLDVQAIMIEEEDLRQFNPEELNDSQNIGSDINEGVNYTLNLLKNAKRPLIMVGQGMISSGAAQEVRKLANEYNIPVIATWRALDFMDTTDDMFFGSVGLQAPRYSNLILQHCDTIIILGSRLDNMITAFSEERFAYRAKKVIVDIDENEIKKLDMTEVYPIVADVKKYVVELLNGIGRSDTFEPFQTYQHWIDNCRELKTRYPILKEKQEKLENVNLYKVTMEISEHARKEDTVVISSTSRCNTAGHIAFNHKEGQKTISSMGMGAMGFAIPSAIGAYYANNQNRVIVIEGDGSLQLNIQELQTIKGYNIDAKIFIFNNDGYAAITTMQDRNFNGHYVGSNEMSGVYMPNMEKIAYAYDIPYVRIEKETEIKENVLKVMNTEGPVICDVIGSLWFDEIPKCLSSVDEKTGRRVSAYLENPYPYLSEQEMDEITDMLIRD